MVASRTDVFTAGRSAVAGGGAQPASSVAGNKGNHISADAKLGRWRLIAFSSLIIPLYAAQLPLSLQMPAIYTRHYGLPLAGLGLIFLLERLWGTLSDLLVGLLSDRTRGRFGRRRPWIVAGSVLYGLAAIPLFFPPPGFTLWLAAVAMFVFYLGWSMMQIPYYAWSGEVSGAYHERTRIATYSAVIGQVSLLVLMIVPTVIDRVRPGDDALKLAAFGVVVLATLLATVPLTLRAFPEASAPTAPAPRIPVRHALALIVGERLLLRVVAADFAIFLGAFIKGSLIIFFVTSYMRHPEWASGMMLLNFVFSVLAGPIWMKAGIYFGKHHAVGIAETLQIFICLGMLLLTPDRMWLLVALTVAQGLTSGSGHLLLRSMLADVADKHRLETGIDRTAMFFSLFSLSSKGAMAAGVGIALPLVAWLGFNPAGPNTPEALTSLLLVFGMLPAIGHAVAAALMRGFPLDEKAHAAIREALERRGTDPLPRR